MSEKENEHEHRLLHAYERMLDRVKESMAAAEDRVPALRDALERVKQRAVELEEVTREEAERIGDYLRRDVEEAGAWLADRDPGHDLRDWLQMDLQMVESWLWDALSSVADQTKLELQGFTTTGEPSIYHTGEIAAPGTLVCLSCGRSITLHKVGHIPPCPGCYHTEYVRGPRA